jgi:hypothetical protein
MPMRSDLAKLLPSLNYARFYAVLLDVSAEVVAVAIPRLHKSELVLCNSVLLDV